MEIIIGTVIGSAIGTLLGIFVLEPAFSRLLDAWDDWRQRHRKITPAARYDKLGRHL